jgi:hypothetical protein
MSFDIAAKRVEYQEIVQWDRPQRTGADEDVEQSLSPRQVEMGIVR